MDTSNCSSNLWRILHIPGDYFWRKTFLLYLDNLKLVQVLFFGPKLRWFYLFGLKIQSIYNKCRKLSNMKFQSSSWPKRSLEKLRSVFAPSFFFIKIMVCELESLNPQGCWHLIWKWFVFCCLKRKCSCLCWKKALFLFLTWPKIA